MEYRTDEHMDDHTSIVEQAYIVKQAEIVKRASNGTPIPSEWAVDANGMPTTDASKALEGAQLCFGGHKGKSIHL